MQQFDCGYYLQNEGICIGSSVAPFLCDIYLAMCDRAIVENLDGNSVGKVFRYVDDYLVLTKSSGGVLEDQVVKKVMEVFAKNSGGLRFTHELQDGFCLQYLDLKLQFTGSHVCWAYHPRTKKGLLPFDSAHSKLVKRSIASSCMQAALDKSCPHSMAESFEQQTVRLAAGGYPSSVLLAVAETLLKKIKGGPHQRLDRPSKRPQVIPYQHRISHNLKKVAGRFDVPVVFSAPRKLAHLCSKVAERRGGGNQCTVNHRKKYVDCAIGVVYRIPLSCGRVYIGQTGRCINERAREHDWSLSSTAGGHLPLHCGTCKCHPDFNKITIMGRGADKTAREILEAYGIKKEGEQNCVSQTSVYLHKKEITFMDTC